jgi:hypothetical protein
MSAMWSNLLSFIANWRADRRAARSERLGRIIRSGLCVVD